MTEIAQNALGLIEAIKDLKSQVTSLTKERDKALVQQKSLEEEVDAIARQLDYETAAGLAYRKVDVQKNDHAINLNQRYYKKIQDLKSQLSTRDEEIKELKEKLESPDYHYLAGDWDFTWPINDDNFLHDAFADFPDGSIIEVGTLILGPRRFYISPSTKTFFSSMDEALASLQSKPKEGEE